MGYRPNQPRPAQRAEVRTARALVYPFLIYLVSGAFAANVIATATGLWTPDPIIGMALVATTGALMGALSHTGDRPAPRPPATPASCFHPNPVAIESVVPGVGVVAWWCPSCDVHGPDRQSLGWTPEARRPVTPRGAHSVTVDGVTTTYGSRAEALRAARDYPDAEETVMRSADGTVYRSVIRA